MRNIFGRRVWPLWNFRVRYFDSHIWGLHKLHTGYSSTSDLCSKTQIEGQSRCSLDMMQNFFFSGSMQNWPSYVSPRKWVTGRLKCACGLHNVNTPTDLDSYLLEGSIKCSKLSPYCRCISSYVRTTETLENPHTWAMTFMTFILQNSISMCLHSVLTQIRT